MSILKRILIRIGDVCWWTIEYGGTIVEGALQLAGRPLDGSGFALDGVTLLHTAYQRDKEGLPNMERLGRQRQCNVDKLLKMLDAGSSEPKVDPLILDLDRDGKVELKNATFFDLDANGFKEYTRWIGDTDAFLVLDNDLNGELDDGSELFGDAMILPDGRRALTGFDALRAFDSNGDGKIDASDEIWASLKVVTGAGEMAS